LRSRSIRDSSTGGLPNPSPVFAIGPLVPTAEDDANHDGIPDYVVLVADLGLPFPVSAVVELKSGAGFLETIVENPRNTAV
jgi:hypothetical protein